MRIYRLILEIGPSRYIIGCDTEKEANKLQAKFKRNYASNHSNCYSRLYRLYIKNRRALEGRHLLNSTLFEKPKKVFASSTHKPLKAHKL